MAERPEQPDFEVLDALLDQALELEGPTREAFLAELEPGLRDKLWDNAVRLYEGLKSLAAPKARSGDAAAKKKSTRIRPPPGPTGARGASMVAGSGLPGSATRAR